jgi:hypothetical protein
VYATFQRNLLNLEQNYDLGIEDLPSQQSASDGGGNFDRVLKLPQITASGVAIIIGAGIYVLLAPATKDAGAQVWLSFLFASALSVKSLG